VVEEVSGAILFAGHVLDPVTLRNLITADCWARIVSLMHLFILDRLALQTRLIN
jgi:hypothetical protein